MKSFEDMKLEKGKVKSSELGSEAVSECTQYDIIFADYTAIERSKRSKDSLMKQVEDMLADDILITWNNVRTLLLLLHLKDTDIDLINRANACVQKIHKDYACDIPKDISEWFRDI